MSPVLCMKMTVPFKITSLCNKYPCKPHFIKEKVGFAGVFIISLFLLKNIDCGYSFKPPHRGGSTCTHNQCFEWTYLKYQNFSSENFHFSAKIFAMYLKRQIFVMLTHMEITAPWLGIRDNSQSCQSITKICQFKYIIHFIRKKGKCSWEKL